MCIPSSAIRSMNGAWHRVPGQASRHLPEPSSNRSLVINRRKSACRRYLHQSHAWTRVCTTDYRRATAILGW